MSNAIGKTAAVLLLSTAIPCWAQTAPPAPDPAVTTSETIPQSAATPVDSAPPQTAPENDGKLEDIIVTAQRRSEQLQRVPIAITALTGATLARAGVGDTQAIAVATPGLQLNSARSSVTPFVRGVGSQSISAGDEGATAIYVDGVLNSVSAANVFALNNVERVEVLRGPQGTLFGRNAVGGLINIITKSPSNSFEANAEVGYGNYDTVFGTAYLAAPITDQIATDFAIYGSHQGDGWGRNFNLGNDVNRNREWAARSKLVGSVGATGKVTIAGDYSRADNDIGSTRQPIAGSRAAGGGVLTGTIYDSNGNLPIIARKEQYGVSVKAEADAGPFHLQSTSAYRHYDININLDSDGTPVRVVDIRTHEITKTFQQELLATATLGQLDLTLGGFYFRSDARYLPVEARSGLTAAANADTFSRMLTNSYAGFVQGTYRFTEKTRFTAGLRYTQDNRTIDATQYAAPGNPRPVGTILNSTATLPSSATDKTFNKLTWRFALDHQLAASVLVYASQSRGFKSGVFSTAAPFAPAVEPETLDAYEIGIKSDLFDRRLRVNLAAFHYTYANIQLTSITSGGVPQLLNAASSRYNGVDGEIVYVPAVSRGSLTLRTAFSILGAHYSSYPNAVFLTPRPTGGNIQSTGDATGNRSVNSPRFTSTVGIDYEVPLNGSIKAGLNATWSYNDGFFWDSQNRLRQPSYNIVNMQASLATLDSRWRLRVYARNLLNEQYYSFLSPGTFGDPGAPAAPRTYGVAIARTF
ncbi:iron complex outermembrane receptor protein [Novosphingobium hassiacum]|uniref:Iron complex outermembrane receptor protein n=1 Tax=Novosphingobium hassiacum TaxID=173676 RepID=A0A7W6EXQ9_9SPHN|nr:TonB-dependent receptor [Novosphingobium hassiacum]MBB3862340.1 iron complex outermembrane receptor protein [Novosphingobium hassiacum]